MSGTHSHELRVTRVPRRWPELPRIGLIGLAYFLSVRLSLAFVAQSQGLISVWLPSGVGLAVLVLSDRRHWPAILSAVFAASVLAHLAGGHSLAVSLGLGVADCVEPALAGWLLVRRFGSPITLTSLREVLWLVGLASIGNSLTALFGTAVVNFDAGVPFWQAWRNWWWADGLGVLIMAPAILTGAANRARLKTLTLRQATEVVVLFAALIAVAQLVFGAKPEPDNVSFPYLVFPLLFWAALRWGPIGAAGTAFVLATLVTWNTAQGLGPFALVSPSPLEQVLETQMFLGVISVSTLVLAAVVIERRRAEAALYETSKTFQTLIQASPLAIIALDLEGKIRKWNPAAERLFGWNEQEVLGRPPPSVLEGQADEFHGLRSRTERGEMVIDFETRRQKKDGSAIDVSLSVAPMYDAQDKAAGVIAVLTNITERKQSAAQVQYQANLLANVHDAIIATDTHLTVTAWNRAAESMYGWTAGEALGQRMPALSRSDLDDARRTEAFHTLDTAGSYQTEVIHRRKDGRPIVVEANAMALRDAAGQLIGYVTVNRDVTERKQAETALRASEEKLRTLFELLPVGVAILDDRRRIVEMNPALAQVTAMSPDDLRRGDYTGRTYRRADGTPLPIEFFPSTQAIAEQQTVQDVEIEIVKEDGQTIWVNVSAAPLPVAGFSAVVVTADITKRKQDEAALRKSETRFRALIENSADAIGQISPEGMVFYVSPAMTRILGYETGELVGQNSLGLVHPDDLPNVTAVLAGIARQPGASVSAQARCRHRDGTWRWLEATLSNLLDEPGVQSIVSNFRDITERKQAEAQIQYQADLLANVHDAVTATDERFRLTAWNRAAELMYGWTAEEVLGQDVRGVLHSRPSEGGPSEALRLLIEAGRYHSDVIQQHKDGRPIVVEANAMTLRDTAGQVTGYVTVNRDITERRRMETALRESEVRFRALIENSADAVAQISAAGVVLYASPAAVRTLGYSLEELIRQDGLALIHPDDLPAVTAMLTDLSQTPGASRIAQGRCRHRDGSWRWIESMLSNLLDEPGVHSIVANFRDITARKQAEAQIQYQADLLANVHDAVIATDTQLKVTVWNRAAERTYGWTAEEAVGRNIDEVVRSEFNDAQRAVAFNRLAETGNYHVEVLQHHRDGRPIYIEGSVIALCDAAGQVTGYVGVNRDITERKQMEEILRKNETRFQALIENSTDAIALVDLAGVVSYASPSVTRMLGYPLDEFVGQSGLSFIHPDDLPVATAALVQVAQQPGASSMAEARCRHRDGSWRWLESTARNLLDEPGVQSIVINIRDVTERRRMEETLRENETRFRVLIENSSDAVAQISPAAVVMYASPATTRILGYPVDELIGQSQIELVHPDDRPGVIALLTELSQRPGPSVTIQTRCRHRDGSWRWLEATVSNLLDEPGVRSIVSNFRDITERKQADEEIKARAQQQAAVAAFGQRALAGADPVTLMDEAVGLIAQTLKVDLCKVLELLPDGQTLLLRAGVGWRPGLVSKATLSTSVNSQGSYTLATREAVIVDDLRAETRFNGPALLLDHGVVSGMSIIIAGPERPFGILGAHTRQRRTFTQDDIHFLQAIAHVLASAIERKRAEEALRDSETRLLTLIENTSDSIWSIDTNYRLLYGNSVFREWVRTFTGYEVRIGDRVLLPVGPPGLVDEWEAYYKRVLGGERFIVEILSTLSHRYIEVSFSPIYNVHGEIAGATVFDRDITARKQAEEALHESIERFQLVARATNDGVWDLNVATNEAWWNESLYKLFGYRPAAISPSLETWIAKIHSEDRDRIASGFRAALARGDDIWTGEYRFQHADGTYRSVFDRGYIMRNAAGQAVRVIGAMMDITARVQAEEALRQTQKMESLGILAGGIAHDFNNLLVAMLGQTSLALTQLAPENPARGHIEKAVKAAERAADLTRQMLAYSGRGQFEIQPLNLNNLIQDNLHLFEVTLPKNARLQPALTEPLLFIEGDVGQIQQVVMNLIINAAEAIGDRPGTVNVSTGVQVVTEDDAHLWRYTGQPLAPGRHVTLEVRDDGHGMDEDTLSKIFDPFFSTKFTGRGLGLAAVLGIVRGHRAGLHVSSAVGKGTSFKLFFPPSAVEPAAPAVEVSRPIAGGTRGLILVIDDEAPVREAVTDILDLEGILVLSAPDGASGVAVYQARQAEIQVVLLDLSMPGLSGEKTFRALRAINPAVRVVLSSGYNQAEATQHFSGLGLAGFLQKPYDATRLIEEMRRQLAGD